MNEVFSLLFALDRVEGGGDLVLDVLAEHDGLAELNIDSAVVNLKQFDCLDNPQQGFFHLLLPQQFLREGIALEHLFIIDCQWDNADLRHLLLQNCINNDVEDVELRGKDLASARPGAFEEELKVVSLDQKGLDVFH